MSVKLTTETASTTVEIWLGDIAASVEWDLYWTTTRGPAQVKKKSIVFWTEICDIDFISCERLVIHPKLTPKLTQKTLSTRTYG